MEIEEESDLQKPASTKLVKGESTVYQSVAASDVLLGREYSSANTVLSS
jgi:hypothetical protein